jgi:hypothetical protein
LCLEASHGEVGQPVDFSPQLHGFWLPHPIRDTAAREALRLSLPQRDQPPSSLDHLGSVLLVLPQPLLGCRDDARHFGDGLTGVENHDAVVQAAVELGLEDGAKLRVDTTVVETDVHLFWRAIDLDPILPQPTE